jgi:hypothetical protein
MSAWKLLQGPLLFPLVPTAQTCSPMPPTKERSHTSFIEMTVLLAKVSYTEQRECLPLLDRAIRHGTQDLRI